MGKQSSEYRQLSHEELNKLAGEELPERAAMSLINANLAIPVNAAVAANVLSDGSIAYAAVAANVLSDGSIAYADATQSAPIDQSNL